MIQPNEIRLGNWVNTPREDQSPFRIDLIEHQSKTYCKVGMNVHFYENPVDRTQLISGHPLTWENEDLEPIIPTEEVLFACGFEFRSNSGFFIKEKLAVCLPDEIFKNGRIYFNSWAIKDHKPKSLHWLQNLYFDLEGKELGIDVGKLKEAIKNQII